MKNPEKMRIEVIAGTKQVEELFWEPTIANKFAEVLAQIGEKLLERIKAVNVFLANNDFVEFDECMITEKFEINVKAKLLSIAFKKSIVETNFNIKEVIMETLTVKFMEERIMDHELIDAFSTSIGELKAISADEFVLHGNTIMFLRTEFLGKDLFLD